MVWTAAAVAYNSLHHTDLVHGNAGARRNAGNYSPWHAKNTGRHVGITGCGAGGVCAVTVVITSRKVFIRQ
jgi:hypothetical protein